MTGLADKRKFRNMWPTFSFASTRLLRTRAKQCNVNAFQEEYLFYFVKYLSSLRIKPALDRGVVECDLWDMFSIVVK